MKLKVRDLSNGRTPTADPPAQLGICPLIPVEQADDWSLSIPLMQSELGHLLLSSMGSRM